MSKPRPLRWFGGKAGYGKAAWIAAQLPWSRESTYVETHGGMFGVGLAREPVKCEIFNDLDERVVNWWRVVRDEPHEFGRLVEAMPHSRLEYERALERVDDPDISSIERALAFHTSINQAMYARQHSAGYWRRAVSPKVGSIGRWRSERVAILAERLWNVQLENKPALRLLEDMADRPHAVIYVDPPYRDARRDGYRKAHADNDVDALAAALLAQQGRVAVSGYGDEWDRLGWRRVEKDALVRLPDGGRRVIEVLWMNYDPLPPPGGD